VQSALGQIKEKIHTSVVEFKGPQSASLDKHWYKKFASDSVMYLSCFGFVSVKLVKVPSAQETILVPVVVALSQIEWEFDTEVGGLFTCPRVFYKDTGCKASSFPRIYVYCVQSHTVDLCRLGPLCSAIEPYHELLEARDYTRRCNEENLRNYRFFETRTRHPPVARTDTRPDMMSALDRTLRALPCHTNSHEQDPSAIFEPSFQKQRLVHALMSQSDGMPCVLPDDCTVSDCKYEVPQLNMPQQGPQKRGRNAGGSSAARAQAQARSRETENAHRHREHQHPLDLGDADRGVCHQAPYQQQHVAHHETVRRGLHHQGHILAIYQQDHRPQHCGGVGQGAIPRLERWGRHGPIPALDPIPGLRWTPRVANLLFRPPGTRVSIIYVHIYMYMSGYLKAQEPYLEPSILCTW